MRLPGRQRGRGAFFIAGLTIPVELIVVPLYFDLRGLGLTNSLLGVILVEIALFMPFSVFWMRTHFQSTATSLVEAARIDGASPCHDPAADPAAPGPAVADDAGRAGLHVVVEPVPAGAGPDPGPDRRTAPAGLSSWVEHHGHPCWRRTVIVMLPILVVYLIFQRSFIAGLLRER